MFRHKVMKLQSPKSGQILCSTYTLFSHAGSHIMNIWVAEINIWSLKLMFGTWAFKRFIEVWKYVNTPATQWVSLFVPILYPWYCNMCVTNGNMLSTIGYDYQWALGNSLMVNFFRSLILMKFTPNNYM